MVLVCIVLLLQSNLCLHTPPVGGSPHQRTISHVTSYVQTLHYCIYYFLGRWIISGITFLSFIPPHCSHSCVSHIVFKFIHCKYWCDRIMLLKPGLERDSVTITWERLLISSLVRTEHVVKSILIAISCLSLKCFHVDSESIVALDLNFNFHRSNGLMVSTLDRVVRVVALTWVIVLLLGKTHPGV